MRCRKPAFCACMGRLLLSNFFNECIEAVTEGSWFRPHYPRSQFPMEWISPTLQIGSVCRHGHHYLRFWLWQTFPLKTHQSYLKAFLALKVLPHFEGKQVATDTYPNLENSCPGLFFHSTFWKRYTRNRNFCVLSLALFYKPILTFSVQ